MAKTVFNDGNLSLGILGTRVLGAWLNKVFSHRHDGKDEDGSAPIDYAVDSGIVANQFIVNLAPPLTAHVPGLPIYFKATQSNIDAATIAVGGLPPAPITKQGGAPLAAGDIVAGQIYLVVWDGAGYQLMMGGKKWVNIADGSENLPLGQVKTINLSPAGSHRHYRISVFSDNIDINEGYIAGSTYYRMVRGVAPYVDRVILVYSGADFGLCTFHWSIDEWQ